MIFKIKKRRQKRYGDVKKCIRFAFVPVKIDGRCIWFEKYVVYKRWTKEGSNRVAYRGLTVTVFHDAWVTFKLKRYTKK